MPQAPRTVGEMLMRAAASADTGLRVLDRNGRETWMPWPAVFVRATRAARLLRSIGVQPGDAIAIVIPTDPAFFDAFFGVLLAGAVPVPLYPPVRLGRLDEYRARTTRMLQSVNARLLLTDNRAYRLLGEVARDARPALGCRVIDGGVEDGHADDVGGHVERAAGHGGPALSSADSISPPVGPDDLALIQFSSGTVVDPKPVALTHRAVVAQAMLLNTFWPDTDGFRHSGVSWLPLYHDMGLIGCVMTAIERPGTATFVPPEVFVTRPAAWLQAISRYRASISPAPNFAYSLATERVRDEEMDGIDLSCWRVALCGAEMVVPDVLRAFQRRFARWGFAAEALTPVYGLSEAALAVTFSDPSRPFVSKRFERRALDRGVARQAPEGREVVSVGNPVPGFNIRIVGDAGEPLAEGRVGFVECRGPSVMSGYLGNREGTAQAIHDGWLATGDLGFICEGELFLTGRAKDVLIVRGSNYAPEEVEAGVRHIDGVRPGCTVAVSWLPEGASGEELLLFVEARRNVPSSQFPDIASACQRAVIAATGLAVHRVVVLAPGTLPRTSSGKLRRQETLKQYRAGLLAPPAPVTSLRIAGAVARSALAHLEAKWNAE